MHGRGGVAIPESLVKGSGHVDGFKSESGHLAVGQNQWYQFGAGAPPILVCFSGDWDVH